MDHDSKKNKKTSLKKLCNIDDVENQNLNLVKTFTKKEFSRSLKNRLLNQLCSNENEIFGNNLEKFELKLIDNSYEKSSLVLSSLKQFKKRDFYSEIRAEFDLKNYLPDLIINWNDEKETNYNEILSNLAQQMLSNEIEKLDLNKVKTNFFIKNIEFELTKKLQSIIHSNNGNFFYDESWVCTIGKISQLKKKKIGLAILPKDTNLGVNASKVRLILLVLSPIHEKQTKNNFETALTFASILCDKKLRDDITSSNNRNQIINLISNKWRQLSIECKRKQEQPKEIPYFDSKYFLKPFSGLRNDINSRIPEYLNDYTDGLNNFDTLNKVFSTTLMIYFSIIMPAIAFGLYFEKTTDKKIDTGRTILGQAIGGIIYSVFCGQPMAVIGTTTLVTLYTQIIFEISESLEVDFFDFYAYVGLVSSLFVMIYSIFGLSYLIKFCTRFINELYSTFIMICFAYYALRSLYFNFIAHYSTSTCIDHYLFTYNSDFDTKFCKPENFLQSLVLVFSTFWLAIKIYSFKETSFFTQKIRELISSYALPLGILIISLIDNLVMTNVPIKQLRIDTSFSSIKKAEMTDLSLNSLFIGLGLGLALSILMFMDQNITVKIIHQPTNNLQKPSAFHLDLFVLAIVNSILSIYGLPLMHAVLPQSPMNIRGLADLDDSVVFKSNIKYVRETRLTTIIMNIMVFCTLSLASYTLAKIPSPVLDGLFLYCAKATIDNNSFIDRILLIFTEQIHYPVTNYVRKCPQRKIHLFTFFQLLQLTFIMYVGFSQNAYLRMSFPLLFVILMPIRHFFLPKIIDSKYLNVLDSYD